jgi:hypothetical protein
MVHRIILRFNVIQNFKVKSLYTFVINLHILYKIHVSLCDKFTYIERQKLLVSLPKASLEQKYMAFAANLTVEVQENLEDLLLLANALGRTISSRPAEERWSEPGERRRFPSSPRRRGRIRPSVFLTQSRHTPG